MKYSRQHSISIVLIMLFLFQMMHSVPNCLTSAQSFETSYFAPPSPPESSPPSSPFDFDLDLLPDEIVSPANLDFSLTTPVNSSNFSTSKQDFTDNNTTVVIVNSERGLKMFEHRNRN